MRDRLKPHFEHLYELCISLRVSINLKKSSFCQDKKNNTGKASKLSFEAFFLIANI